ncbi:MAG: rhodanese-like domain-containing protein [Chloroflexota bacterium]|nr:rhodanese-like domain-containing protein [Chloroflexota bacterium]
MMQPPVPSILPRETAAAMDTSVATDPATRPLIVDVREPDEFGQARIDGVVLMPISQFVARHAELPKDRPLLMLCAAGSRSTSATMYLLQAGWTDVRNVTGGMIGWQAAGLPVRTGPPDPGEGDLPA